VFHTCGALSSRILRSAHGNGASVASLHPLQSLANVQDAVKNLQGSYFCIEGDESACAAAKEIVSALGGLEISVPVYSKPLYHAGASVVSNFLVATIGFGLELFEAAGINRNDALKAVMPLIKGTVNNIVSAGIPLALTGPVSRGDTGVIEGHMASISAVRPELTQLYCELGRYTVKVAIEKGTLKMETAQTILSLFDKYCKI
jgi:predicted short-subunit dehydrogenase-like oxidoreductase (DUF2520 family)